MVEEGTLMPCLVRTQKRVAEIFFAYYTNYMKQLNIDCPWLK